MVTLIYSILGVFVYVLAKDLMDSDEDRELIEKCIPNMSFIRRRTKSDYIVYQFVTDGKSVDPMKLMKLLQDYLGKEVKVFFDRVLTVRVYKKILPRSINQPEVSRGRRVQIGECVDGVVWHDFGKYPHMIVAGTTGYGKTNFLKGLLKQLDGEIILLDLKGSDDYDRVTAKDIGEAASELKKISQNLRVKRSRRVYVVIDEAAELLAPAHLTRKESKEYLYCQSVISEIARLGRSLGVSLIYSTQYPTADVLPRQVKQNCETRVVFRLPTTVASSVALDESGAERLETGLTGRAIYKTDSSQIIQTYLCKDDSDEEGDCNVKVRNKKDSRGSDTITVG